MIKVINILEVPVKEIRAFELKEDSNMIDDLQKGSTEALKSLLSDIEKQIKIVINQDPNLKELMKILCSVVGIGKVTACEMIITTNGFKDFAPDQAKSYARNCAVVPLSKSSGKFKRKPKISKKGNSKMKSLLTTCALSLINTNTDLGRYYKRKTEGGKKPLTVLNAMRNKLILRAFAVVRNNTMYERNMNISLE